VSGSIDSTRVSEYGRRMAQRIQVTTEIAAPPETVWGLVSDLSQMGKWSPESEGVEWLKGATGPAVGVTFKGSNRHGSKTWTTHGRITEALPNRALAFLVNVGPFKVSEWRYEFEPIPAGCRVTESTVDHRGAVAKFFGKQATGIEDRDEHNRATMAHTLERLKAAAEAHGSPTVS
jgi:uncharacterized protein YndB with AHSA1/START domain